MSEYLILDLVILIGPLLASFEKQIRFIRYFIPAMLSILLVGSVYIAWDIWATDRGHWSFNPEYVGDFRFLGLPAEEMLFFWVVPYAGLFIWHVIGFYREGREDQITFSSMRNGIMIAAMGLILGIGKGYEYTGLAFLSAGLFLMADQGLKINLTQSVQFWYTQVLIIGATLLFNGFLTSRPVVLYGESFQLGLRIFTIPVEDFVYGFSLCAWVMLVFRVLAKGRR
jgi:lycopene cyclase domain-containing protein